MAAERERSPRGTHCGSGHAARWACRDEGASCRDWLGGGDADNGGGSGGWREGRESWEERGSWLGGTETGDSGAGWSRRDRWHGGRASEADAEPGEGDEWSAWWDKPLAKAKGKLTPLAKGSTAAVVTFAGSFCPVTRGHVACLVEARALLLGQKRRGERWVPPDLEEFAEVVGFIGCNSDRYVSKKLAPLPIVSKEEREALIDLAAEDLDWLSSVRGPWDAVEKLRKFFPHLRLVHFVVDGADVALYNKPWRKTAEDQRSIVVEREGDEDCGVDALRRAVSQELGEYQSTPQCIFWPPLSAASSTAARRALLARDLAILTELLHPKVMQRLIDTGPWQPDATG